MHINHWLIQEPKPGRPVKGCIIALPGRGVPGGLMLRYCHMMGLPNTLKVALVPKKRAWYPQPNGPEDQDAAVHGLNHYAVPNVLQAIEKVKKTWDIPQERIALLGFSAGAVVALQIAIESAAPYAACVSLAGAILVPEEVPPAHHQTPIILCHGELDFCFMWWERYLPMRQALTNRGYCVRTMEKPQGEHCLYVDDSLNLGEALAKPLGYSKSFVKKALLPRKKKILSRSRR